MSAEESDNSPQVCLSVITYIQIVMLRCFIFLFEVFFNQNDVFLSTSCYDHYYCSFAVHCLCRTHISNSPM